MALFENIRRWLLEINIALQKSIPIYQVLVIICQALIYLKNSCIQKTHYKKSEEKDGTTLFVNLLRFFFACSPHSIKSTRSKIAFIQDTSRETFPIAASVDVWYFKQLKPRLEV